MLATRAVPSRPPAAARRPDSDTPAAPSRRRVSRPKARAGYALWLGAALALPTQAQQLPPLSGAAKVDAGGSHTCAQTTSGSLLCWGRNHLGQLGVGWFDDADGPHPYALSVVGLAGPVAVFEAGDRYTCSTTTAGKAQCWGDDFRDQLGNGPPMDEQAAPVDVVGLGSGVTSITAGGVAAGGGLSHSCALAAGGAVKCWGFGNAGQLGDGQGVTSNVPVSVVGLTSGAKAVTAGDGHSCAITAAGGAKCWGINEFGELGNPTAGENLTPVDVTGLTSGVAKISAGADHTCAVTTAGGAKCWGNNSTGALGTGTTGDDPVNVPVDVTGLTSGVAAIAAGYYFTCALTTAGAVKCWGANDDGQIGNGSASSQPVPTPTAVVGLDSGVTAIAVGVAHACAVTADSHVKCWGFNNFGQLGDGTDVERSAVPVEVVVSDAIFADGFEAAAF